MGNKQLPLSPKPPSPPQLVSFAKHFSEHVVRIRTQKLSVISQEVSILVGSHDPIFSLALFQLIEMLIRVSNFFEFEQKSDRVNQPLEWQLWNYRLHTEKRSASENCKIDDNTHCIVFSF